MYSPRGGEEPSVEKKNPPSQKLPHFKLLLPHRNRPLPAKILHWDGKGTGPSKGRKHIRLSVDQKPKRIRKREAIVAGHGQRDFPYGHSKLWKGRKYEEVKKWGLGGYRTGGKSGGWGIKKISQV